VCCVGSGKLCGFAQLHSIGGFWKLAQEINGFGKDAVKPIDCSGKVRGVWKVHPIIEQWENANIGD